MIAKKKLKFTSLNIILDLGYWARMKRMSVCSVGPVFLVSLGLGSVAQETSFPYPD